MTDYIIIDLETTGTDPETDQIIEVAMMRCSPEGKVIEEYSSLVHPSIPLTPLITAITNISEQDVASAPLWPQIKDKVATFIGSSIIIGHNVQFDLNFLKNHGINLEHAIVYDTFEIASIILPDEESLALEILSDKYEFARRGTHRALDDVRATHELFFFLLKRWSQTPRDLQQNISHILSESNWSARALFMTNDLPTDLFSALLPVPTPLPNLPPLTLAPPLDSPHAFWLIAQPQFPELNNDDEAFFTEILKVIEEPNQLLLFEHQHRSLLFILAAVYQYLTKQKNTVLILSTKELQTWTTTYAARFQAWPLLTNYPHLVWALPQMPPISATRLANFLAWPHFHNRLAITAAKATAWYYYFTQDELHPLQLTHQEKRFWPYLKTNWDDPQALFPGKNRLAQTGVLLMVQQQLTEPFRPLVTSFTHTILDEAQLLENQFDRSLMQRLQFTDLTTLFEDLRQLLGDQKQIIEELDQRWTMVWGLLGILLKSIEENGQFILIHNYTHTRPWQQWQEAVQSFVHDTTESLSSLAKETSLTPILDEIKKTLNLLDSFTHAPTTNTLSYLRYNLNGEFALVNAPQTIPPFFQRFISDRTVVASSTTAHTPENEYLKRILGLQTWREHTLSTLPGPSPTLLVPNDLPNPLATNAGAILQKMIATTLEKLGGETYVSMDSQTSLDQFYNTYYPTLLQKDIKLLVQGFGGQGKNLYKYINDHQHSIMVGTNYWLQDLDPEKFKFKYLILTRLPFDFTGDPHLAARKGTEQSFLNYDLPRALLKYKQIINKFNKATIFIFDRRIIDKKYGVDFLQPPHTKTNLLSLAEILKNFN